MKVKLFLFCLMLGISATWGNAQSLTEIDSLSKVIKLKTDSLQQQKILLDIEDRNSSFFSFKNLKEPITLLVAFFSLVYTVYQTNRTHRLTQGKNAAEKRAAQKTRILENLGGEKVFNRLAAARSLGTFRVEIIEEILAAISTESDALTRQALINQLLQIPAKETEARKKIIAANAACQQRRAELIGALDAHKKAFDWYEQKDTGTTEQAVKSLFKEAAQKLLSDQGYLQYKLYPVNEHFVFSGYQQERKFLKHSPDKEATLRQNIEQEGLQLYRLSNATAVIIAHWLKQGQSVAFQSDALYDLSELNFADNPLHSFTLNHALIRGVRFKNASLKNSTFDNCFFGDCRFSQTNFEKVTLKNSTIQGCQWTNNAQNQLIIDLELWQKITLLNTSFQKVHFKNDPTSSQNFNNFQLVSNVLFDECTFADGFSFQVAKWDGIKYTDEATKNALIKAGVPENQLIQKAPIA